MVMKYRLNNLTKVLLVLIVFYCVGCADKLRLIQTSFTGNQLRIDGYYYDHYLHDENRDYYDPIILYRNGVIINGWVENSLESIDNTFLDEKRLGYIKNNQERWGIYQIEGDSIKIEKLYHSNAWFFQAYIMSAKILNDTTFVLTTVERSGKPWTKKEELPSKYHFRQFCPKPDSTNIYVK